MNARHTPAEANAAATAPSPWATVVGGEGYIGRHLVAHLRAHGWRCQVATRHSGLNLQSPLGTVFYAAGLTNDFAQRPHDTVAAHVSLLSQVLQQGRFDALVYLSSTRLYDALPGCPGEEDAHLALNPANPRHLFDLSKALGESLCRHAGGGRARVARLSCVVGGSLGRPEGFVGELLQRVRQAGAGARLAVDTNAQAMRDYVLMDDALRALELIATRGTQPVYNVASGENIANADLLQALGSAADCALEAQFSQRLPMPATVSVERMRLEFGWQARPLLPALPALLGREVACAA